MATTADCLKFIETLKKTHPIIANSKSWKRQKKYKVNGYDIREFINPEKSIAIVISEEMTGELNLVSILHNEEITSFNGKEALVDILTPADKVNLNTYKHLEIKGHISYLARALSMFSNEKNRDDFDDVQWSYALMEFEKVSHSKIAELTRNYMFKSYDILWNNQITFNKNWLDKFGILFSCENVNEQVKNFPELPGFQFIHAECGGDWEYPIHVFLYISAQKGEETVSVYVPQDKGNIYIKSLKCAVGSVDDYGFGKDVQKEEEYEAYIQELDCSDQLFKDTEKFALESFKNHLLKTEKKYN